MYAAYCNGTVLVAKATQAGAASIHYVNEKVAADNCIQIPRHGRSATHALLAGTSVCYMQPTAAAVAVDVSSCENRVGRT